MAKGGARARSGPAPDPEALRRDRPSDAAGWVALKATDCAVEVPEWPLEEPTVAELVMWAREWKRPQSLIWQWNGLEDEVALYVRNFLEAAVAGASASARTLVKQQREALFLSMDGLARARVRIVDDEKSAAVSQSSGAKVADSAASTGLTVITGGRAAA